jgi:hypothetical protein
MKEFVTAIKAVESTDEAALGTPVTIKVDDREVTFSPATSGQIAILLAGASDSSTSVTGISSAINFFFSLLDNDDDRRYFKVRLLDRTDPFEAEDVTQIVMYLVEEWSGRPTKQPSDFLPSQESDGQKSTVKRHRQAVSP